MGQLSPGSHHVTSDHISIPHPGHLCSGHSEQQGLAQGPQLLPCWLSADAKWKRLNMSEPLQDVCWVSVLCVDGRVRPSMQSN